jgi:hypothetical protein
MFDQHTKEGRESRTSGGNDSETSQIIDVYCKIVCAAIVDAEKREVLHRPSLCFMTVIQHAKRMGSSISNFKKNAVKR